MKGSLCNFGSPIVVIGSLLVNDLVGFVMACVLSLAELGVSSFSGACAGTCSLALTELKHDGWHT